MRNAPFFPSESAVFHFQRSRPFTTLFLLFWCGLWDCVYSARRQREQGTDVCVREVEGGSCDLPITRQPLWLARDSAAVDVFTAGSECDKVCLCVCVWMRSPLGRTASTFQMLMLILMQLNIKCVGARRGVITERATQETRGRLAQWSGVAVVIVISGHRITPWYSQ